MHSEEYRRLYDLEDQYWWFVARRRLALSLLQESLSTPKPAVLDLGCGTGVVSHELMNWAAPISLDMSPLALDFCRERQLTDLVQADGTALPFRTETLDGIIALDVFEHIGCHERAFAESCRVLKSGGVLTLSVPAFQFLWGPHDEALMHQRRYRIGELRRLLESAGFDVEFASYSIHVLFPVVVATRMAEKLKRGEPQASLPLVPSFVNRSLIALQDLESAVLKKIRLPWGSSIVAVARKR